MRTSPKTAGSRERVGDLLMQTVEHRVRKFFGEMPTTSPNRKFTCSFISTNNQDADAASTQKSFTNKPPYGMLRIDSYSNWVDGYDPSRLARERFYIPDASGKLFLPIQIIPQMLEMTFTFKTDSEDEMRDAITYWQVGAAQNILSARQKFGSFYFDTVVEMVPSVPAPDRDMNAESSTMYETIFNMQVKGYTAKPFDKELANFISAVNQIQIDGHVVGGPDDLSKLKENELPVIFAQVPDFTFVIGVEDY